MAMTTYTTRNEAIQSEIIESLGTTTDLFDIEAIADEAIQSGMCRRNDESDIKEYRFWSVETDTFWKIVEKHAK